MLRGISQDPRVLQDAGAEPRVLRGHDGPISILAFHPQGRWLATRGADWAARLWDLVAPEAEPHVLGGHQGTIQMRAIAIDTQGHRLATAGRDGPGRLFDLQYREAQPQRILDERTLLIPERPGNRLADSLRSLLANPHIGLLFVVPGVTDTFRVYGRATITTDQALLAPSAVVGKPPRLGVPVSVCISHAAVLAGAIPGVHEPEIAD